MGYVEPFGHAMIESFLDDDGLHYLRDRDGDFLVQFGYDDDIQGHPRFLLAVAGDQDEQYCLRGDTLRRVPKSDWERFLRLCNEWNAQFKMPKVYLEIDDPNSSATGRIVCEQWVDLEPGTHQELINHLTTTFFSACFGFWRWLVRQDDLLALGSDEPSKQAPKKPGREPGPRPDHERATDPIDDAEDLP